MDRHEAGINDLVRQLGRWDGRRRKVDALLWMPRGLLLGLLIATIVAGIVRLYPILFNRDLAHLTLALSLTFLLISGMVILLRKRSTIDQANFADRHFYLQERMSTAVEIHERRIQTNKPIAELQLDDSLRKMVVVDTNLFLPLRINRRDFGLILLTAGLLVAAIVLPNPAARVLAEQRALERAIVEEAETIRALVQEIDQDSTLTAEQRRQLLSPLRDGLERLQRDNVSQEQAVAALSETSAKLRELSESNDTADLEQSLRSVEQSLMTSAVGRSLGQALSSAQLNETSRALSQFAESLTEFDATEAADLAEALATMADGLETTDPELASELDQAAEALASEDLAAAREALNSAAETIEERAQQREFASRANETANELAQSRQVIAQAGQAAMASTTSGGEEQSGQGQQGQQSLAEDEGAGQPTPLEGGGVGGIRPGGGHAEQVYVPPPADLTSEEGVDVELPAECTDSPENCGFLINESPSPFGDEQSLVPYDQVFSDYRNTAYQALESDYIPLNLRSFVRDYFSSLEP